MYVFLSPTKTMKKPDLSVDFDNFTTPFFLQKAEELNSSLKKQNRADLGKLMKLSDKLAEQTWCNIQKWGTDDLEKTPAVLTYQGTAFKNLNSVDKNTVPGPGKSSATQAFKSPVVTPPCTMSFPNGVFFASSSS